MRKLFSSPRIENVEAVAKLLEDAGIEVRVSNGRSYRGAIRGNFSYREHAGSASQAAVWVIRADQQPEARRLLREAGLLQELPVRGESYLPSPAALAGGDRSPLAARGGGRFRYGLLLAVAVMVALVMIAYRAGGDGEDDDGIRTGVATADPARGRPSAPGVTPGRDAPSSSASPAMPGITSLPETAFVIATPPALAATLLRSELAAAGSVRGCLSIDGADPDLALLESLREHGLDVVPASGCAADDGRLAVSIARYVTDGSGSGTVEVAVGEGEAREVAVQREGRDWRLGNGR